MAPAVQNTASPENEGLSHSRNGTTSRPAGYSHARSPRGRVAASQAPTARPVAVSINGANSG